MLTNFDSILTNISGGVTFPIGSISQTEFDYLDNLTSAIQTQLNSKPTLALSGGKVPLTAGGTASDLSSTGATTHFLRQATLGGAVTVGAIASGDLPNHSAALLTSGTLDAARLPATAFVADTSTTGFLHATSTAGKQMRLAYDSDSYEDTVVSNTGYVNRTASPTNDWSWASTLFWACSGTTAYMGPLLGNEMFLGGEGGVAFKFDSEGGSYATRLSFYGVTPIERAVLATGTGKTVDNVITALQNLGLVKQS